MKSFRQYLSEANDVEQFILDHPDLLNLTSKELSDELMKANEAFYANECRATIVRVWALQKIEADRVEKMSSIPTIEEPDTYRGQHSAPMREDNGPMFDVSETYGEDFYSGSWRHFIHDDSYRASAMLVLSAHNRPNMAVKIYRAVPKSLKVRINPGDWVSLDRRYCVEHGRHSLNNDYRIISKTVYARDLFSEGDLMEWGYDPQPRVPTKP